MASTITVWVADVRERWTGSQTSRLLESIPEDDRGRVGRYRRWQDRQMSIAGRVMIGTVMRRSDSEDVAAVLSQVTRLPAGRPGLPFGPDFNLAHSGGLVLLAVPDGPSGVRVGVDIEVFTDAWADVMDQVLTASERASMATAARPQEEFYRIWTYKEAVVKADGRGLSVPPDHLSSLHDHAILDGTRWSVKPLPTPAGYAAHLAVLMDVAVRLAAFRLHDGISPVVNCFQPLRPRSPAAAIDASLSEESIGTDGVIGGASPRPEPSRAIGPPRR